MSTVRELHNQAMQLAQQALLARQSGDFERAEILARQALPIEVQAAERITKTLESEPTRSILYRSAASLAYQSNDFAKAQRLVAEGLAGNPPPRVEQELKDLFEQINFANHLQIRDATLDMNEVQLALTGKEVASGSILYSAFRKRAEAMLSLLDRTMRRMMGQAYQQSGSAPEAVRPFQPILASPRAGSFAVSIRLVPRLNQTLPLEVTGARIIDDVLSGIELVQQDRLSDLQSRFEDAGYYNNFLAGAKLLSPDGERVNFVGLTSPIRQVAFIRHTEDIPIPHSAINYTDLLEIEAKTKQLHGILDQANGKKASQVALTADDGQDHILHVKEGLEDVVRTYFMREVTVFAEREGAIWTLVDIQGED